MNTRSTNKTDSDEDKTVPFPLFSPDLPEKVKITDIYPHFSLNECRLLAQTSKAASKEMASFLSFQSAVRAEPKFFKQEDGTELLSITILKIHPEFLFEQRMTKDHFGRKIWASPYQLLLGAGDVWAVNQVHEKILPNIKDGEAQAEAQRKEQFPDCLGPLETLREEQLYDDRNKAQIEQVTAQLKTIVEKITADPCTNGLATLDETTKAVAELCQIFAPKEGEIIKTGLHFPLRIMREIYMEYNFKRYYRSEWNADQSTFFSREVIEPALRASTAVDLQCYAKGLYNLDMKKGPDRRNSLFPLTGFVDPYDGLPMRDGRASTTVSGKFSNTCGVGQLNFSKCREMKLLFGHTKRSQHITNLDHQLATTKRQNVAFYQFTQKSGTLNHPSLFLDIYEKNSKGTVVNQDLYKSIFLPDVELNKSYIPGNPPLARNQRGHTCGLIALEIGLTWGYPNFNIPPARKNPIKPTKEEKEKNKNILSLRATAKKYGSKMGEIYDMNVLKKTAEEFDFMECNVINMSEDRNGYIERIKETIKAGHSIILPVNNDNGFPGTEPGHEHHGLAWGFIYRDNQYHFLVTHWGKHYLWSANDLQKSHEQMRNCVPQCERYKYPETDKYSPVKEGQNVPKGDLRIIPPSNLDNFRFTGLTIPTPEKNFLSLENTKIDEKFVKSLSTEDDIPLEVRNCVRRYYDNAKFFAAVEEKTPQASSHDRVESKNLQT